MFRFEAVAVLGAELGPPATVSRLLSSFMTDGCDVVGGSLGAFKVIGGGLFFPAGPTVGAALVATGTGSGSAGGGGGGAGCGTDGVVSCKALKFRFFRIGVAIVVERNRDIANMYRNPMRWRRCV